MELPLGQGAALSRTKEGQADGRGAPGGGDAGRVSSLPGAAFLLATLLDTGGEGKGSGSGAEDTVFFSVSSYMMVKVIDNGRATKNSSLLVGLQSAAGHIPHCRGLGPWAPPSLPRPSPQPPPPCPEPVPTPESSQPQDLEVFWEG